jgi:hypothetical protein
MGYTTTFEGEFKLDKPLKPEHAAYLAKFAETRRMKRDADVTATRPDPVREAVALPVGVEGGYFVGSDAQFGQEYGAAGILDSNQPPDEQPGLWCQWVPTEDGTGIVWDSGEKFYAYIEWIEYLIANFLAPWGYTLNGTVEWLGEDADDRGQIVIKDNVVKVLRGQVKYVADGEPEEEDLRAALTAALPLLVRLGDFIGNDENRCEVILQSKRALGLISTEDTPAQGPGCGHSACRQNWIDTASTDCVAPPCEEEHDPDLRSVYQSCGKLFVKCILCGKEGNFELPEWDEVFWEV